MILSCPSCQTRFVVDPDAIGEGGRRVRCAKCGDSWHQLPVEEVAGSPAPEPDADADDANSSRDTENGDPDQAAAVDPDTDTAASDEADTDDNNDDDPATAPTGDKARRARSRTGRMADRQAEEGTGRASRVGWLVLALVLLGFGGAGFFYQQKIVEIWPPAGQLFELIGLTPEAEEFGLAIQNVKWEHKRQKGRPVLVVLGEVINTSGKPRSVPRLRVVIRDESDRRLFRWTVTTTLNSLEPGQATKFSTRLANPPEGARSLAVSFLMRP